MYITQAMYNYFHLVNERENIFTYLLPAQVLPLGYNQRITTDSRLELGCGEKSFKMTVSGFFVGFFYVKTQVSA